MQSTVCPIRLVECPRPRHIPRPLFWMCFLIDNACKYLQTKSAERWEWFKKKHTTVWLQTTQKSSLKILSGNGSVQTVSFVFLSSYSLVSALYSRLSSDSSIGQHSLWSRRPVLTVRFSFVFSSLIECVYVHASMCVWENTSQPPYPVFTALM